MIPNSKGIAFLNQNNKNPLHKITYRIKKQLKRLKTVLILASKRK
jgi:hypothetical protein